MTSMDVICYMMASLPAARGQFLAWLLNLTWAADLIGFEVLDCFHVTATFPCSVCSRRRQYRGGGLLRMPH